ncbi:MAG: serine/threonine protein kinase [Planctomycetaceae bacterium]|nr:serine/threonine protein kinase [Planctomycetaceae bacterium]
MSASPERLSIDQLLQLEQICDQFESDYRQNCQQELDVYLQRVALEIREPLLIELNRIVGELRNQSTSIDLLTRLGGHDGSPQSDQVRTPKVVRGNRFELHERLGAGGAGTVWRAYDRQLERWVALKAPHEDSKFDPERFHRESQVVARLQHPRIVRVLDAGKDQLGCYMISELIEGESLADKIKHASLDPVELAALIAEIADGIAYAHSMGIVHRDLKPQNILIDKKGNPHITDFGLAKQWKNVSEHPTQAGRWFGTPAFMAPEQVAGAPERIEPRTDVYALGVILFQLLTGELPFRGNVDGVLHQITHVEAPSARVLKSTVPIELDTLCAKCLEKSPNQRIASAELLAAELRRFANHQPILSRPIGPMQRLEKFVRRHPGPAALGALAISLILLLAVISTIANIVVNNGWNREVTLRVNAETARRDAEQASREEAASRKRADEALQAAELNARRALEEAELSRQSLAFLESILHAADPVNWVLGSQLAAMKEPPGLPQLLDGAANRIKIELANQPRVQTRLMDTIANSYRGIGRYGDAVQLLEQSQLIRNAVRLSDDPTERLAICRSRFFRGMIHQDLAEFAAARQIYDQVIADLENSDSVQAMLIGDIEFQLGWMSLAEKNNSLAKQHFAKAISIRQQHSPSDSAATRAAQVGLELAENSIGDEFSIANLGEVVRNGDNRVGQIVAEYLQVLALRKLGQQEEASLKYGNLLKQLESLVTDQHPLYLLALGEYADLLRSTGDFRNALISIERAISIGDVIAPQHPKLHVAREALANELMRAQRFSEAAVHYSKILDDQAADPNVLWSAHEGMVWLSMRENQLAMARVHADYLLKNASANFPLKMAWANFACALIHDQDGNAELARAAEEEAVRLVRANHQEPHLTLWLERQAAILNHVGDRAAACEILHRAVEIERTRNPKGHPYLADRLSSLAGTLVHLDRLDEACEMLEESLRIRETCLPGDDIRINETRELLGKLSVQRGQKH